MQENSINYTYNHMQYFLYCNTAIQECTPIRIQEYEYICAPIGICCIRMECQYVFMSIALGPQTLSQSLYHKLCLLVTVLYANYYLCNKSLTLEILYLLMFGHAKNGPALSL